MLNKFKYAISGILTILVSLTTVFVLGAENSKLKDIRIKIYASSSVASIKVNKDYSVFIDGNNSNYIVGNPNEELSFQKKGNKIIVTNYNKQLIGEGTEIKLINGSNNVGIFEVKNNSTYKKYPDSATIRTDSTGKELLIINETPIEVYLMGVVPYEIGPNAPLEALKAQSITARTVAVARLNKYIKDGYDITDTTSDQVYKGYNATYNSPTHNIYKAVEQTKGMVLSYNGGLISGTFYASNGGQTASNSSVWSAGYDVPYYVSNKDAFDTYNHKTTPYITMNYSETYSKEDLRNVIIGNSTIYPGYFKSPYFTPSFNGLSENYNIEVLSQSNGYITQIKLSDDQGRSYIVKNYANRWVFGLLSQQFTLTKQNTLHIKTNENTTEKESIYAKSSTEVSSKSKSTIYVKGASSTKKIDSTSFVFKGKGYGHGVGMSQNGAMNRAEAGHSATQILEFYYSGAKVISNYGNK